MKKLLFGLCVLFFISGCKQSSGSDGYIFEQKQWTKTDFSVHIVEEHSFLDIKNSYDREHNSSVLPENEKLMAFSILHKNPDGSETCIIHIIDPLVHYYPEFIGHELTHCIYGQFHPHQ